MQNHADASNGRNFCWIVTAGGLLLMALSMGIISNCYSVYTIPVTENMGYTRQAFSFSQTLIFVGMMLMTFGVGFVIKRTGLIYTIRIASFMVPGIYFLYSVTGKLWQFYLVSFLIGAAVPMITTVPLSMLVGEWFRKNAGVALGIVMMGSGIGGMIFNPVISFLIQKYGWRFAFRSISVLMLVLMVPIAFLAVKAGPYSYGGQEVKMSGCDADRTNGISFSETLKTDRYRLFLFLSILVGAGSYSIINFTATYLQDAGYTPAFAAAVASASMAGLAVGKPLLGRIYDRTGLRETMFIGIIFIFIAEAAFAEIKYRVTIPAVVLGVMLGCPLGTIASPIIARTVFGSRDYSMKCGLLVSFGNLGASFTPILAGEFYAKTGSFKLLFSMIAVLMIVALFGYAVLLSKKPNRVRR